MNGLKLIRRCAEFVSKDRISEVPPKTRGIYALLKHNKQAGPREKYEVVYIGMSRTGIRSRLAAHNRSVKKSALWNYFSVYEVWPNITDDEIAELEGLFRAIYRRDSRANRLAIQKSFRKLRKTQDNSFKWD
jgi:hypothetical protein